MDPRGAYFNQQHLHEALRLVFHASDEGTTQLRKWGAKANQSEVEVLDIFAYKLRVMFAHSRTMDEHTPKREAAPGSRKNRLHPFVAFRQQEENESGDEEGDYNFVVSRYFTGAAAIQLMSDGAQIPAERFEVGDEGFAKAVWIAPSRVEMDIDLPNSCVNPDGTLKAYEAPPPKRAWKRPASDTKRAARPKRKPSAITVLDSDGDAEAEDAKEAEPLCDEEREPEAAASTTLRLQIAGGHGSDMVVFCFHARATRLRSYKCPASPALTSDSLLPWCAKM